MIVELVIVLAREHMNDAKIEPVMNIFPSNPTPGALTVFVRPNNAEEVKKLEEDRTARMWEVRAYLSDHAFLAGPAFVALKERGNHSLFVNPKENP
jgi:hypothetical protein